jgi:hypothetical protein
VRCNDDGGRRDHGLGPNGGGSLAYRRIDGPIARVGQYRVTKLRIRSGVHAPTVAGSLADVNPGDRRRMPPSDARDDAPAEVVAVRVEPRAAQSVHELHPQLGDHVFVDSPVEGVIGEPVPRHRRHDDIEADRAVLAVGERV